MRRLSRTQGVIHVPHVCCERRTRSHILRPCAQLWENVRASGASVYIDAPEDIEMAHRAGVRAIGVLGGSPCRAAVRPAGRLD